ncbi:DeoR/GlpR family DNA-binding transcription regulator [Heyndrickxia ginsengihumi]|uniref:DeoR/GlpR family DNA-binding transcription regulator n=1 Tax=Heyndrickxia ginsengihumi TaxID=363870 RepID=UPI001DCEDB5C|nr:DeoR/GlpR family DNA-binding transcription regulator [Heyndrickxia ginsengihumi]MBE6185013.1 DeoR/GlpR transcriptional regulator [Bacillus sp. (in: firmicutes)]MCM3023962.1 DeoR/GlpR family DNA-binding transcription regulator [Heyndrickxia ginsengihumi]
MKMFAYERRSKIIEILQDKKRISVKELASQIGVSEATLRTDLTKMEEDGLLTRTHGGAVLNEELENETSFSAREKRNKNEKMKIAETAFELIQEKQCILLDASSTALELARLIKNKPIRLTVVTSGLQAALELKDNPDITVILIGGVVTKKSTSIEGTLGINILDYINIDIMFTSANGFTTENGLEDFNLYEVELKKEIVKRAAKVIAIIDSSKIGKSSSAVFAKLNQIDKLITDKTLNPEFSKKLAENHIEVILAP